MGKESSQTQPGDKLDQVQKDLPTSEPRNTRKRKRKKANDQEGNHKNALAQRVHARIQRIVGEAYAQFRDAIQGKAPATTLLAGGAVIFLTYRYYCCREGV